MNNNEIYSINFSHDVEFEKESSTSIIWSVIKDDIDMALTFRK